MMQGADIDALLSALGEQRMSQPSWASAFEAAVLAFTWRQWGQLGVSAAVRRPDNWAQDPEALLLFSLQVARREPRMFDEVLDWTARSGGLLMRQRLQNLLAKSDLGDLMVAGAALAHAGLPSLARSDEAEATRALFDGPYEALADLPPLDPIFARHGLRRPPFRPSGKSVTPDLRAPAAFAFRLRAAFGPGTRSEALRCLLLRPERPHGTAELAALAGLSRVGVHQALEAAAAAGICERRQQGRKNLVWWVEGDRWWAWLGGEPAVRPRWVAWPDVYLALLKLWRWAHDEARVGETPYMRASNARAVALAVAPLFRDSGLPAFFALPGAPHGEAYWPAFEAELGRLVLFLEAGIKSGV